MQKCWKCANGELSIDSDSEIWVYESKSCRISITAWYNSKKGPMTEIVFEFDKDGKKQVIIECLETKYNRLLSEPKYYEVEDSAKNVMEICDILLKIDTNSSEYWMVSSLQECVKNLANKLTNSKCFHVYHGNGLFFGMSKSISGKMKFLDSIPRRCMEFPGSRLDSIAD